MKRPATKKSADMAKLVVNDLNPAELALRGTMPKIDFGKLHKICRSRIRDFHSYGEKFRTNNGVYYYKDNGADILAVAHLDTLIGFQHFSQAQLRHDTWIFCTTLDDRLGAYALIDYLPQLGMKYDLLLTEGEEKGASTAAYFQPPLGKKYKWMFSLDLMMTGFKMYQYESKEGREAGKAVGLTMHSGSYSDIRALDFLGCQGFNFGVGYQNHHSINAMASVKDFKSQMRAFAQFYHNNKDTHFPYTPKFNCFTVMDGFSYDPKEQSDFFSQEEINWCQQLYEDAREKNSVSKVAFETKMTKNVVRIAMIRQKKTGVRFKEEKMNPDEKVRVYDQPGTGQSYKMGLALVAHPTIKPNKSILDLQKELVSPGKESKVLELCRVCGDEYQITAGIITDSCPTCRQKATEPKLEKRSCDIFPLGKYTKKVLKSKITLNQKNDTIREYVMNKETNQWEWKTRVSVGFEQPANVKTT